MGGPRSVVTSITVGPVPTFCQQNTGHSHLANCSIFIAVQVNSYLHDNRTSNAHWVAIF
jgi:hypothetical protein